MNIKISHTHIYIACLLFSLKRSMCAIRRMDDALQIYYCVDSGTFADLKVHG